MLRNLIRPNYFIETLFFNDIHVLPKKIQTNKKTKQYKAGNKIKTSIKEAKKI